MTGFGDVKSADEKGLTEAKSAHLLTQMSGLRYYPLPGSPMDNQYASVFTILAIQRVAQNFYRDQRIQLGIGDLSQKKYGAFPRHTGHKKGTSVDIRPIRKDRAQLPVKWQDPTYDRATTQKLVNFFLAEPNVKKIFFNDPHVSGVQPWTGHDNHPHVEMKL